MGISKILIFPFILGLATCGADRCSVQELTQAFQTCETAFNDYVNGIDDGDMKPTCSGIRRYKTCVANATNGCDAAIVADVSQATLSSTFNSIGSKCPGLEYTDASSTSGSHGQRIHGPRHAGMKDPFCGDNVFIGYFPNMTSCVDGEGSHLRNFYKHANSTETAQSILNDFCINDKIRAQDCFSKYFGRIKTCENNSDIVKRITIKIMDFICDNKKTVTEAAFTISTDKSLYVKEKAVDHCILRFNRFDDEGCRKVEIQEKCVVNALSKWDNYKSISELLDSLLKSINNELPCTNLEKSHASSASVVSVALLITTVAISLSFLQ